MTVIRSLMCEDACFNVCSPCKGGVQLEALRKRNSRLSPTLVVARAGGRLRATSGTKEPALSRSPTEKSVPRLWEPCYPSVRGEGKYRFLKPK